MPVTLYSAVPEFHVRQNWTEGLIESQCSAQFTNSFNLTGEIHWAGVPATALESTQNQTREFEKEK